MEKLKINIHITFILFACVLVYFGQSFLFLNYLIVMFIHELSHAFVARKLGYNIKNIKLIPFGICLNINSVNILPKDEIKIALAGPIINFFLALCTIALWWIFPESYNYTYLFCYANFITGVFNLIPAFPLDGGRVLLSFLKLKSSSKKAVKVSKLFNIIIAIFLFCVFIYSCFTNINLTYFFVCLCVLSGIFEKNNHLKYSIINYGYFKKIGKVIKIKPILVSQNEPLYIACKYIDNFSYISVNIADEEKNIIATYTEVEFLKLLERYNATTPFKYVLKVQKLS